MVGKEVKEVPTDWQAWIDKKDDKVVDELAKLSKKHAMDIREEIQFDEEQSNAEYTPFILAFVYNLSQFSESQAGFMASQMFHLYDAIMGTEKKKAIVNQDDSQKFVDVLSYRNNIYVLEAFLSHGIDPNAKVKDTTSEVDETQGNTPKKSIIEIAKDKGFKIEQKGKKWQVSEIKI